MELPDLGQHCSHNTCNKLDFLPIKCDLCSETFCDEHYFYTKHNCAKAYQKNNLVPVCPLCNKPIPIPQGMEPDRVVGAHIDNDCQSDPAVNQRKVFTNKCTRKGCKVKEVIPVLCGECQANFCLKHRHPQDHQCQGRKGAERQMRASAAMARQTCSTMASATAATNGSMSEDEALARALALSMQETSLNQSDLDLALARQLQASEYQGTTAANNTNKRDKCAVS